MAHIAQTRQPMGNQQSGSAKHSSVEPDGVGAVNTHTNQTAAEEEATINEESVGADQLGKDSVGTETLCKDSVDEEDHGSAKMGSSSILDEHRSELERVGMLMDESTELGLFKSFVRKHVFQYKKFFISEKDVQKFGRESAPILLATHLNLEADEAAAFWRRNENHVRSVINNKRSYCGSQMKDAFVGESKCAFDNLFKQPMSHKIPLSFNQSNV